MGLLNDFAFKGRLNAIHAAFIIRYCFRVVCSKLCADLVRTRLPSQAIGLAVRVGGKRE